MKAARRIVGLLVVLGLAGAYGAAGFFEVAPDEQAAVLRLGRYHRTVDAGLRWRLPLIETVETRRVTVTLEQEFGFRTIAPGPPPEFEDRPDEKAMLTRDANVVSVEFVLQYRIADLPSYLFRVGEVRNAIHDVAQSVVREVVAQHVIDEILTEAKGPIEEAAEILIQSVLDEYGAGVEIQNVQLQDVEPPTPVKDAFAEVANAQQDRERLILEAEGYADQIVPQARGEGKKILNDASGYRESRILEAEGATDRFEALLIEYRKAPEVTRERIYLETIGAILPRVEKVIIEEGPVERVVPYLPLPTPRSRP